MAHRDQHAMMGAGRGIRIPLSETAELDKAIKLLRDSFKMSQSDADEALEQATSLLVRLRSQVIAGYHRNPGPRVGSQFQAGTVIGKIGTDVHDIRYTHESDGQNYEHHFGGDAEVWAVQRNNKRELLITHVHGKPLWEDI